MDNPGLFDFPPTTRLHRERTRKIHTILSPDTQPPPSAVGSAADYCLAHHTLEGAESAARSGERATFDWYTANPRADIATPTTIGPRVVVAPDLTDLPRSPISETPYYVLGPGTEPAPLGLRTLAADAFATAADTGFGTLLTAHAVVVVLLRTKQLDDTLDSWTITRLPGTVFLDHVGDPVVLARDLIHEAGHNWLNDALTATGCKIDDQVAFHSPWKQSMRPAFGFLHACWAFPLTMLYTARVLEHTEGDVQRFLTAYLDQQRGHLATTAADHPRALELVGDEALRERLAAVHRQALTL
ncbi:HEXXH motif-containing putative peptide modification protein [Kitasatospora sp. NBC_01287]|uniref:aKG-HExxH-type peptide beta-hydroxylase n=1 Tax=Kitasatospora sp. NBC_01287 TaxID=2903573 RepID=UPI002258C7F6|nr:HEXXH motif-containing putative peptide modification protein [Kitasatospora sp. NBC_01287]MCX4751180.1 HEXXH motif-containing putative peptide modification protein [Kitasatospora sp. NBC_01287]